MADKAGFLTKEGGSIKTWKKRWCVLKNGALRYSKSQSSGELGIIHLKNAGQIAPTDLRKNKKNCFTIETPERTYFICAPTPAERDSWIKELITVRDRLQGKNTAAPAAATPAPAAVTTPAATPAAAPATNGTTATTPAAAAPAPKVEEPKKDNKKVGLDDFNIRCVVGKGSFGKVLLVEKKDTKKVYAMKVLNKKKILSGNELEHTKAEKNILQRLCHPFLVNLNYSFQTPENLYFIMDYVNGGELFYHLQKEKKFDEPRVRFYCAEIVLGLEYLHNTGVLYRDLKPENILLTGDGHICMTDFGISKEGLHTDDDRTATFCGTPEYLAPEVLEGVAYGKAVDWWSFGTLMYEMLNGLPPFYSQDVQQMYSKIMTAKLTFPKNISEEAKSLIEQLLVRDPEKRLQDPAIIKKHPFFKEIDWDSLLAKEIKPPFIPPVKSADSAELFDSAFTNEDPHAESVADSTLSNADQANFADFTYVADSPLSP